MRSAVLAGFIVLACIAASAVPAQASLTTSAGQTLDKAKAATPDQAVIALGTKNNRITRGEFSQSEKLRPRARN